MKKYAFLLLFFIISIPFIYTPLKSIFFFVSKPILQIVSAGSFRVSHFIDAIRTIRRLVNENEQLRKEVQKLNAEIASYKETERENEVLRKQLNFIKEHKDKKFIMANVIARSPGVFIQYLVLDKGKKDGVEDGQVVVSEGFLVGKIVEVNYSSSKVFIITNPTSTVAALTSESRAFGLVKGEVGYGISLLDIPKEAQLKPGEAVVTSGLGGEYPKGIIIGQIEKIEGKPTDLFQRASLKTPIEFSKIEYVLIIEK